METTTFTATEDFPHPAFVGVTDLDETLTVQGDPHEVMPLASVTKLLTAWGALVALDRGVISLEDAAGPAGSTVHNLLDHSSGLPFEGEEPQSAPGERRIYSNSGFDALAAHIAHAAGMDFSEWMRREVTEPLDMTETDVTGRAAAGARSSVHDLLIFGREVLRPTLIPASRRDEAVVVSRPGLRGVVPGYGAFDDNQWGLGFEVKGAKQHWMGPSLHAETAGHFGAMGSFLFIEPTLDIAACFLSGVAFGPDHKRIWPALTDEIVARYGE